MPELKRLFYGGKMNKDLDERLVPNGEYVDALNIQVTTSENSEVGTAQNVLGNTLKNNKTYTTSTQTYETWSGRGSIANLTGGVCIGSIRHDASDCIYWFIADSNGHSYIAEYNSSTTIVSPKGVTPPVDKSHASGASISASIVPPLWPVF